MLVTKAQSSHFKEGRKQQQNYTSEITCTGDVGSSLFLVTFLVHMPALVYEHLISLKGEGRQFLSLSSESVCVFTHDEFCGSRQMAR